MGKCLTIVKLVGIGSLGVCTSALLGSAAYLIPQAIKSTSSVEQLQAKVSKLIISVRFSLYGLGSLATYLFYQAFTRSPLHGQHPYLIYSGIAIPAALIYGYYNVYNKEQSIINNGEEKTVYKKEMKLVDRPVKLEEETSPLDNSVYTDLGSKEPKTEQVEEEVEVAVTERVALSRDQLASTLDELVTQYWFSGAIVGAGFLMSCIGYLGDNV